MGISHLSFQIVLKLFQEVCHFKVTLKVVKVIVHPQQDYPCNLAKHPLFII